MESWQEIKVSDIGKVVTGNTPPRKNPELYGNHTIFIKPTDVTEDVKYTRNPEECYSAEGYRKFIKSLIPKGATCVVTIGSIGKKITKAHCDCFINQAMNAVIPNSEFDEEFVYYLLKYNLGQLKTFDSGTASGRENVSKSSFSSIKLRVPQSKAVQINIGKTLSAYDDLIENNLRRIKLLEELAQRTYEEWFVRFRFPGHETAVFDEETGLPEGWERCKLGAFVNVKKGKNITRSTISEGKVPVVAGGLSPAYYHNAANTIAPVITVSASGANAGFTKLYLEDVWASDCSYIDSAMSNAVHFTYSFLKFKQVEVYHLQKGSAQPHVYPKDLMELEIELPPSELLQEFEEFARGIFQKVKLLQIQNQRLTESREILLPKLMSGQLLVS